VLGRLKLVDPPQETLTRGDDGLFRVKGGGDADADPNVAVAGAALEGSNVNVVDAMVNMISLARQFDLQMSMMKNAENNEAKAGQLLALGG
jgi:flagellar basal-body rod protein FlgF